MNINEASFRCAEECSFFGCGDYTLTLDWRSFCGCYYKLIHNLKLSRPFVKDFDTFCSPANVRSSSPGKFVGSF